MSIVVCPKSHKNVEIPHKKVCRKLNTEMRSLAIALSVFKLEAKKRVY